MDVRGAARAAIAIAAILLFAPPPSAHAEFRDFFNALITNDASPSNQITLQPGWVKSAATGSKASFSWSIEKQLSENFSLEVGDSIADTSRRRFHAGTGLDDLEIFAKYSFYKNVEHQFRAAAGLDVFAPTGDVDAGAESHTRAGPALLLEKGLDDLPERGAWRYLRPFAIQAETEYTWAASGHQSDIAQLDLALSYQLTYLRGSFERIDGGRWSWLARLTPFSEFNYQQGTFGRFNSTPPDWRITPGIAWSHKYYEVTVGTQLALNDAAIATTHAVVLVGIAINYDEFTSWGGAMLF